MTISLLESGFPHIVEKLTVFWGHPELREYLDEIFIDRRGGRQGFPIEVINELIFLRSIHEHIVPKPEPKSVWDNYSM